MNTESPLVSQTPGLPLDFTVADFAGALSAVGQMSVAVGGALDSLTSAMKAFAEAVDSMSLDGWSLDNGNPADAICKLVPGLRSAGAVATCPCLRRWSRKTTCGAFTNYTLPGLVVHLNDDHRWSRERIADWLDDFAKESGVDLTVQPAARPKELMSA